MTILIIKPIHQLILTYGINPWFTSYSLDLITSLLQTT